MVFRSLINVLTFICRQSFKNILSECTVGCGAKKGDGARSALCWERERNHVLLHETEYFWHCSEKVWNFLRKRKKAAFTFPPSEHFQRIFPP